MAQTTIERFVSVVLGDGTIVDGSNPLPTSATVVGGGSATSYTDEASWTAGNSLFNPSGGVYNDSATALTTGQQGSIRLTANRAQHVNLRDSSGSEFGTIGNPVYISGGAGGAMDGDSWTAGSSAFSAAGGVYNDSATALSSGDEGTFRSTANRALHINLRNNSGTEIGTSSNPVRVDTTGSTSQPITASSLPLPTGAATEATLGTVLTTSDFDTKIGSLTETAPATDTASSGLNGRAQRIAQRITSLIALIPTALTGSGNFKVSLQESNASQAITAASLPLPAGAATESTLSGIMTGTDKIPSSPSTDRTTAGGPFSVELSDGSSFYTAAKTGQLPTSLTGSGNLKVSLAESTASQAITAASLPLPSGAAIAVADEAAWTAGSSSVNPVGGVFNDSAAALTSGQEGTIRLTANRAVQANLRDSSGNELSSVTLGDGLAATPDVLRVAADPLIFDTTAGTVSRWLSTKDAAAVTDGAKVPAVTAMMNVAGASTYRPIVGNAAGGLYVQGPVGAGNPPMGNPQNTGCYDGTDMQFVAGDTSGRFKIVGAAAHGDTVAGNPLLQGGQAIAHGTNPTAVTAGQATVFYANRAGIPFMIGGHPNVKTIRANYTSAQTDTALVTVSTGTKIVVTGFMVIVGNAVTVNVSCVLGFGTANTPTTTGVLGAHPNIAPGSGFGRGGGGGILGIGADNEDLRITLSVPTTGSVDVVATYYTIES